MKLARDGVDVRAAFRCEEHAHVERRRTANELLHAGNRW